MQKNGAEELSGIEEMEFLNQEMLFQEGINNRLVELGYNRDIDSVDCKIDFLRKEFQKNKVEPQIGRASCRERVCQYV